MFEMAKLPIWWYDFGSVERSVRKAAPARKGYDKSDENAGELHKCA